MLGPLGPKPRLSDLLTTSRIGPVAPENRPGWKGTKSGEADEGKRAQAQGPRKETPQRLGGFSRRDENVLIRESRALHPGRGVQGTPRATAALRHAHPFRQTHARTHAHTYTRTRALPWARGRSAHGQEARARRTRASSGTSGRRVRQLRCPSSAGWVSLCLHVSGAAVPELWEEKHKSENLDLTLSLNKRLLTY